MTATERAAADDRQAAMGAPPGQTPMPGSWRPRRTLVVPMFQEEARIGATVHRLAHSSLNDPDTEILFVDDGSDDETAQATQAALGASGLTATLLCQPVNRGKGAAVRTGVLAARGRAVAFSDADLSAGVEDIERCFRAVETGEHDVVLATRASPDSEIPLPQPRLRQLSGKLFNVLLRLLGLTRFHDTQCGLKAFTDEAARSLFEAMTIDRFAFDVELLWRAEHAGLRVRELAVVWRHVEESRVSLSTDSTRMLLDVLRLRMRLRKEVHGRRRANAGAQV